jgi:hypothetical protein
MPMPPPEDHTKTGGRLSGYNVRQYMEDFAERFLKGRIRFETEVLNIHKGDHGQGWSVHVRDRKGASAETAKVLYYPRIVLCTGVSFISTILATYRIPTLAWSFRGTATQNFPSHYLLPQRRQPIFRALYYIQCSLRRGWMTYSNARHLLVLMLPDRRRLWLLSEVESRRKSGHDLECFQATSDFCF